MSNNGLIIENMDLSHIQLAVQIGFTTAFLVYSVHVFYYVKVASDLIYSPTSAWWKQTAVIGSACLHSAVDLAATPNPRGKSFME